MTQTLASATRQVQWDVTVPMVVFMYASALVAVGIFAYGVERYVRVWRLGKPAVRWDRPWVRVRRMLAGIGHATLMRRKLPGAMHALIFAGMAVLFAATVVVFVEHDLHVPIMHGALYLYFQSFTVDAFGLLVLVGVAIAAWRRYVAKVPQLEQGRPADGPILAIVALIVVTGFLLQGIRIAATADPWAAWSPAGYALALVFAPLGASSLEAAYRGLWLFHVAVWHASLAAVPFTKMIHGATAPLNIFFGNVEDAHAILPPIDFESPPPVLGIRSPLDMTWKQLFDLDACTECGRCQSVCPAFAAEKPLSPKRVILDARDHVRRERENLVAAHAAASRGDTEEADRIMGAMTPLAGGVIRADALWACTTCRACEDICPVSIEHVPFILGMRQHLAMEQAEVPAGVADAVAGLEARKHPYHGMHNRDDWYADLSVREMASVAPGDVDVLYWVGCAAIADQRLRGIARSVATVLNAAGVRFAVLGKEEQCCGDPARRTGNEFHFAELARENIEKLGHYNVKTIVTHCPHCLQTIGHDYERLGGDYEVVHHTEFVRRLIADGRLSVPASLEGKITYHDPCYLGRYNGVFDAPRETIDLIGGDLIEMPRRGRNSSCCGSGGGHAFYEDGEGTRINGPRTSEALATGAKTIATGCPFCVAMLEDGVRTLEGDQSTTRVRDVVELVAEALTGRPA